jgi:glycosyltransferase involved in cell wall biosynthesis
MLKFLEKYKNPLIITDNHLSCDIPNKYNILLVHHGCAKTTSERNPDWGEPWKSLCTNGQNKMLDYRDPKTTTIISISQSCTDDFTKYYGEKYTKFKRLDVLHPSELDETRYKKNFNDKPIILGNWNHPKKGQKVLPHLKSKMKDFNFKQLSVGCNGKNFEDFNKRKQDIYLGSDIFLQIATSEGNSYATLDALICGLVIVASDVGLFYKDVPENCFVKLDWRKNNDVDYVEEKILEAWSRREELSKNCRQWYLDNCRFIDWEKKMNEIVN